MSLRRNMAWIGASQAAFFFLQFGGSVVVARLLTPYETGVYAIALAVVGALSTIQAFGLSGFVVREPEIDEAVRRTVLGANLILSALLSATVFAGSLLAGQWLRERGVTQVLQYLSLLPLLDALQFMPSAMLERNAQFRAIAVVNTCRTLTTQVVTIIAAANQFSYLSMAYGQIAASIVSVVCYNVHGRRHILLKPALSGWRRIARFGFQMLVISGVNNVTARLSEAALGRLVGLAGLGLYSRASNLNNLAWENIHLVIGRVLFVELADRRRRGDDLRPVYLTIIESLTALLWPVFAGLAVVSGPFIALVYGERWVGASHPLVMLAAAAIILVAISMTWEMFVVCGETAAQARLEVIRTTVGLSLFASGAIFGLTAAAAARVLEAAFGIWLYRPHLDRMSGTHTRDVLPIYARSALLTLVAIGPAAVVMGLHHASERTPLLQLLPAIAAGVLLWSAGLVISKHPLATEARSLLSRARTPSHALSS